MLLRYLCKGVLDRRLRFKVRLVDQAVQPPPVVERLDLGEDRLDGVELRAVADVVDRHDVKAGVVGLDGLRLVNRKLIAEQRQRYLSMSLPQLLQIVDEVFRLDGSGVDPELIHSLLLADRSDDGLVAGIDVALIDSQVGVLAAPFLVLE